MKQIFGKSIVHEGAPFGNKNAAGPHNGGGGKVSKSSIGYVDVRNLKYSSGKKQKRVVINRNVGKANEKRKVYFPTNASFKRLQGVIAARKASGSFKELPKGLDSRGKSGRFYANKSKVAKSVLHRYDTGSLV